MEECLEGNLVVWIFSTTNGFEALHFCSLLAFLKQKKDVFFFSLNALVCPLPLRPEGRKLEVVNGINTLTLNVKMLLCVHNTAIMFSQRDPNVSVLLWLLKG